MISIIVPVYNGERYIDRCIKSLINNKEDIEIIIINDGSNDNTANILKNYEDNGKIKVINQKNQGVSAARNKGIDVAQGTYIMFCDADDCYGENTIENISKQVEKNNIDLLIFGRKDIQNDKIICEYPINKIEEKEISHIQYLEEFFCNGKHTFSVVNKVYKSDIIKNNKLRFSIGTKYSEDTLFNLEYILYCKYFYVIENCYYLRYCNDGSSIYKKCENFYWNNIKIIDLFIKRIQTINQYKKAINELYIHYAIVSIHRICYGIDEYGFKKDLQQIKNIIKNLKDRNIKIGKGLGIKNKILYFLINTKQYLGIYAIFNKLRKIYQHIIERKKANENK